jgi:hypothetical protein
MRSVELILDSLQADGMIVRRPTLAEIFPASDVPSSS